jgi:DnaJ like chaperone protein
MSFWHAIVHGVHEMHERHRQAHFAIAVVALAAKMARADGAVTPAEVRAFHDMFQVPPEEAHHVERLFDQMRRDASGYEHYARQAAKLFKDEPAVLERLLDGLFHIAKSDRIVGDVEIDFLRRVAEIFGFDLDAFTRIREGHLGRDTSDPYVVLGISHAATADAVHAAWRKLAREHHPDRLIAQGMPAELVHMANERLAAINAAYERIKAGTALKPAKSTAR